MFSSFNRGLGVVFCFFLIKFAPSSAVPRRVLDLPCVLSPVTLDAGKRFDAVPVLANGLSQLIMGSSLCHILYSSFKSYVIEKYQKNTYSIIVIDKNRCCFFSYKLV